MSDECLGDGFRDKRSVAVADGGGNALKGQIMINSASNGPWANPAIEDGVYFATVERITIEKYGDDDNNEVIRMTFRLDGGEMFRSNLYLPHEMSRKVRQRLSFLCMALETDRDELMEWPMRMTGRRLALEIGRMQFAAANNGIPYCDVHRFVEREFVEAKLR